MNIEQARLTDAADILSLQKIAFANHEEVYGHKIPPLLETIEETERDIGVRLVLKLCLNRQLIGAVRGYLEEEICYVSRLIIDPTYQNQGYGKRLMHEIEKRFSECEKYCLETGSLSFKNLNFYKNLGYSIYKEEDTGKMTLVYLEKWNK